MALTCYIDESDIVSEGSSSHADTVVSGAILIDRAEVAHICAEVEKIKASFATYGRLPVKWNFKDLRDEYKEHGLEEQYSILLKSSQEWRTQIFNILSSSKIEVVVSCIATYKKEREYVNEKKPELRRMAFTMILQRVALSARDKHSIDNHVIMDWPSGHDKEPYDREYTSAFNFGKTADGINPYKSGPLSKLGFQDCVGYSTTIHSTMLQVTDLVVGASKDVINSALGRNYTSQAHGLLKAISPRFRGAPNFDQVLERGFCVSRGNSEMRRRITEELRKAL